MPRVIETTVYQFEELSDKAKEKAREWYREGALDYDWWDSVYEDAATIAELLGIELKKEPVKLMGGGTRYKLCIQFSGFCSQGDGACFEGTYRYRKNSVKDVMKHAPKDEELHRIAKDLQWIQRAYRYQITATVTHNDRYCHERSVDIEVDFGRRSYRNEIADEVAELLRAFMKWIYRALEREYEYLMSDESVDEMIVANEYEFDESGKRT